MDQPRPIPGWQPSTPEIQAAHVPAVLEGYPMAVIHCWAEWNGHDIRMEALLRELQTELEDQVQFFSCSYDLQENVEFMVTHGVLNLPCLLFFAHGKWVGRLIGTNPGRIRAALANLCPSALPHPEQPAPATR